MNKFVRHAVAIAAGLLASVGAHAADLIVNGGFELPVVAGNVGYVSNVVATGWTGKGDLAVQGYNGAVSSGEGNQWWDLNPGFSTGTGLSQSVSLIGGTAYNFSFLYDGGGGGSTNQISFSIASGTQSLLADSVSTAGMNVYNGTPWSLYTATVTASADTVATLKFTTNGSYSGGFIDAIRLDSTPPVTAVPEPEAYAMMLAGLGVALRYGRRRSKSA